MARVKGGEAAHPSAPTVAKLRMRYAKRGRARFSSHRDVARTMEWTLRRAGVPVALSQGFSPHPRLSWIGAAPTGAASEAEYLEIGVTEHLDPGAVAAEVDRMLPDGLAVVEVVLAGPDALADRIDGSRWSIEVPIGAGAVTGRPQTPQERLAEAADALMDSDSAEVQRSTKNGPRPLDVRAALVRLSVAQPPSADIADPPGRTLTRSEQCLATGRDIAARSTACGTLSAVVRHTTPAARPDDVVSALRSVAGLEVPEPVRATREAQGRLDEHGGLADPFEADRAVTHRAADPDAGVAEDRTV